MLIWLYGESEWNQIDATFIALGIYLKSEQKNQLCKIGYWEDNRYIFLNRLPDYGSPFRTYLKIILNAL